jgi:hypothetical protein
MPFEYKKNTVAINLTGAIIKIQLRKVAGGVVFFEPTITITNAVLGQWKINKQIIDIEPFNYLYDIRITFANGDVETWGGQFNFLITDKITE